VGALGHYIEREGVPTAQISLIREQTAAIRPPRALWVPFMLGRPFGVPNEPAFQRKVLRAALLLLERDCGPVLEDYPEDAPATDAPAEGFACPVSFAAASAKETNLAEAMRRELAQLAPWYDLAVRRRGRTTVGISGMTVEEAASHAACYLDGSPRPPAVPGVSAGAALKRACDDVKAFYYEAAAAQPGNVSPETIDNWFWRETAAARVFLAIQQACLRSSDESLQPLGKLSLVPRAVSHLLADAQPAAPRGARSGNA
jgi:hypothetical protein